MLKETQLLREIESEAVLLTGWIDKTLDPSMALLSLSVLVGEMESDIFIYQKKNGKTDNSEKSKKRVNEIVKLVDKLSVICHQNNTYHLIAKHASIKIHQLNCDNSKLKKELEAIKKAFNEE